MKSITEIEVKLEELKDKFWALRAYEAEEEGYLSIEESEVFLYGLDDEKLYKK